MQDNTGTLRIDNPDPDAQATYRRVIHAVK
jgi:hypothetical protein